MKKSKEENIETLLYCYEKLYHVLKLRMNNGSKFGAIEVLQDIRNYDKKIEEKKDIFTEKQLLFIKSMSEDYKEYIDKLEKFL
jgi:hypothetical protein